MDTATEQVKAGEIAVTCAMTGSGPAMYAAGNSFAVPIVLRLGLRAAT